MTPQEELDLANLRYREIADEFNRIKGERNQIAQVAKDYINATPEQQQNASAEMQSLINRYNSLGEQQKNISSELVGATERIAAAESAVRKAQPTQQSVGQRRRQETKNIPEGYTEKSISQYGLIGPQEEPYPFPENTLIPVESTTILEEYVPGQTMPMPTTSVEYVPGAPENPRSLTIPTAYSASIPERQTQLTQKQMNNLIKYQNNQPGTPAGSITSGQGPTFGDYVSNFAQGFTENISPYTWVYQNNSRAPGYNLGRTFGNAFIPVTAFLSAGGTLSPTTTTLRTPTVPTSTTTWGPTSMGSYAPAYTTRAANTVNAASRFANGRTIPEAANKLLRNYANSSAGESAPLLRTLNRFLN